MSMLEIGILLTIACLGIIFCIGAYQLFKHPPVIAINFTVPLPDRFCIELPKTITVQNQHIPAVEEMTKPEEEAIPEEILLYCLGESDSWAQEARKRRARVLRAEVGSWDAAFRILQREDSLPAVTL